MQDRRGGASGLREDSRHVSGPHTHRSRRSLRRDPPRAGLRGADRLRLLDVDAVRLSCERAKGRRGIGNLWRLVEEARAPSYTRSPLENRFIEFYRGYLNDLPEPHTNVSILDHEVDAFWPRHRLVVEMDSWEFHGHRAAFERDRSRDAAMQAAGYRVIRLTHRACKPNRARSPPSSARCSPWVEIQATDPSPRATSSQP